jgi:hypothetical protein
MLKNVNKEQTELTLNIEHWKLQYENARNLCTKIQDELNQAQQTNEDCEEQFEQHEGQLAALA